jgi:Tfp pilus assembly PilM family ATPase
MKWCLIDQLKKLWAEHKLSRKGIQIVIDSTQFQIKNATFPKLREAAIQELVENEFIGNERYSDPLFDYMVLRDNPTQPQMIDVLCCGVESNFIHSYVELFQDALIQNS